MTKASKTTKTRLSVDEWVDAGIELLADEGLAAVKIDRLCKQLGVTKGSFYWHFADLAAFLAALAERWGELRDARKAAFAEIAEVEPRARVAEMMELLLDPGEWSLERAVREWARTDESVRDRVNRSDKWVFAEVRRALLELGFDKEDADIRARGLFFVGVGFIHAAEPRQRGGQKQRDRLVEIFTS
jgi:AcrR family transcriptional regulator